MNTTRAIDLVLVGLGHVHRQFLHLVDTRRRPPGGITG